MKVILIKDVKGTGKKDDIVEVKDGFGNYLLKNSLGVQYSLKSQEKLNQEINTRMLNEQEVVLKAKELKTRLEKVKLSFIVKTGTKGKVFGCVSTKQIAEELNKQGFQVDKKKINVDTEINTLGVHNIKIILYKNIIANLNITVGCGNNG